MQLAHTEIMEPVKESPSKLITAHIKKVERKVNSWLRKQKPDRLNFIAGIVVMLIGSGAFAGTILYALNNQFSEEAIRSRTNVNRAKFSMTEGDWFFNLDGGTVTLQAHKGIYQLIYIRKNSKIRRFSRGLVEADGNYLVFYPKNDLGKPDDTSNARYFSWPLRTFAVSAAKRDGKLVWKEGPISYSIPEKLLAGPHAVDPDEFAQKYKIENPLFLEAGKNYIIWDRLIQ
jgi:hypothetical protein